MSLVPILMANVKDSANDNGASNLYGNVMTTLFWIRNYISKTSWFTQNLNYFPFVG